ncbi:amidohydrolase [Synergistaceae bacterium OttesenSCG-928-I11]|nr:amidohydrolase [Synergistaceae bacterium OttesenSCG-928-I11]
MYQFWNDSAFEVKIRDYRRDFHKYAEVKWTEFRTASIVAQRLDNLGIRTLLGEEMSVKGFQFAYPDDESRDAEIARAIRQGGDPETIEKMDGLPGAVGIIEGGKPGPVIAFRFDMDALLTTESDTLDHYPRKEGFRSVNEGYCHACGHDGHTAMGLGLAEVLMANRENLCGTVKLIFQPSEEGGGGARGIVARGILDDVKYFFAVHVGLTKLDGLPLGQHGLICGVKDLLDSRRYDFRFRGKAAHSAGDPHVGKNALLASCHASMAIHSIPPHSEGVMRLNVGVQQAGVVRNAVPADGYIQVDMRAENDVVGEYAERRVQQVVAGAAAMYENELETTLIGKTCAAASDDEAITLVRRASESVDWFTEIHDVGSAGGTDDAAEMIRRVQRNGGMASYAGLGCDFAAGFHNEAFDFDESVMIPSIRLLNRVVELAGEHARENEQ